MRAVPEGGARVLGPVAVVLFFSAGRNFHGLRIRLQFGVYRESAKWKGRDEIKTRSIGGIIREAGEGRRKNRFSVFSEVVGRDKQYSQRKTFVNVTRRTLSTNLLSKEQSCAKL